MPLFGYRRPTINLYTRRPVTRVLLVLSLLLVSLTFVHLGERPSVDRAYDYVAKISQQAQERWHHLRDNPQLAADKKGNTDTDNDDDDALPPQALWHASQAGSAAVADYVNFLVDRYQLSSDLSWYARRVRPQVTDAATAGSGSGSGSGDAGTVEEPLAPQDDVGRPGRPSLTRARARFVLSGGGGGRPGFVAAHAPGHKALQAQMDRFARVWQEEEERAADVAAKALAKALQAEAEAELASELDKGSSGSSGSSGVSDLSVAARPHPPAPMTSLPPAVMAALLDDSEVVSPLPVVGDNSTKNDILRLPVIGHSPRPDDIDASMLLFGISSTYARLRYADFALLDDWARWLTDGRGRSNGATLLLSLHKPRRGEAAVVRRLLAARGIDFRLHVDQGDPWEGEDGTLSDPKEAQKAQKTNKAKREAYVAPDSPVQRYSALLPLVNAAAGPEKQFVALVDDDVFFPSMGRLLRKLRQHLQAATDPYSTTATRSTTHPEDHPTAPDHLWIGFPSDVRSDWVFVNGSAPLEDLMGVSHGGSAVFLAPALARQVASNPACLAQSDVEAAGVSSSTGAANRAADFDAVAAVLAARGPAAAWDTHLFRCVVQAAPDARLRLVPSFYAPSDAALYTAPDNHLAAAADARLAARLHQYAGGSQPLTLHNYRVWHRFNAGAGHRVASVCGEACFLQRFVFDDDWVLVNGHSLAHYPRGSGLGSLFRAGGVRTVPMHRIDANRDHRDRNHGHYGLPKPLMVTPQDHAELASHPDFVPTDLDDDDVIPIVGNVSSLPLPPPPADRERRYALQQRFWRAQKIAVEEPERPDDLRVLLPPPPALPRRTWMLLDAQTTDDGSVLQAYVRRGRQPQKQSVVAASETEETEKRTPQPKSFLDVGGRDEETMAGEAEADADEDSLVLLIWEKE